MLYIGPTMSFFGNPGIRKVMTKNRFEELSCYLHFNDSSKEPARGDRDYDRLYKVRTILDYVLGYPIDEIDNR